MLDDNNVANIIDALERCRRYECDDCTEEHASKYPWDCVAYDERVIKAVESLKELNDLLHKKQKDIDMVRPIATVEYSYGNDGRDAHHYIAYRCPTCRTPIPWYKYATACDKCGTFYDWGNKEPSIEITRSVKWE